MAEWHLIKINITRWIVKPRPNTWWNLATGDFARRRVTFQKYRLRRIYERTVHQRFWMTPYERLNSRITKHKFKHSLDLDCFESKRNVDDACILLLNNIQYNINILTAREGNKGNCHPSKINVNLGYASVDIGFLGVTICHVTLSCSQYLYNIPRKRSLGRVYWFHPVRLSVRPLSVSMILSTHVLRSVHGFF